MSNTFNNLNWAIEEKEQIGFGWEANRFEKEENFESSELEEIYSIIFPDQPDKHNFLQLKHRISELKINELTLQVKNQQEKLENLISETKNSRNPSLLHVINLLLDNQRLIEEKRDTLPPEQLQGRKEAYCLVLADSLDQRTIKNLIDQGSQLYILEQQLAKLKLMR